ncbi:MAG: hypothetical protein HZR80_17670 [Candidatus Heimdallarchaeota archaeon]
MSYVSWYPKNPRERLNFFLRTFPAFLVMLFVLYYVLDWVGAFEFLEILVRDNSVWLLKVIFGYENANPGLFERRDLDPLTGGIIRFGTPHFPGLDLGADYPRILLIIRACTGMEAGALLGALIFITPAKWENKVVAHITNLLMMHIGNTFRVTFHFWFTQYLYGLWGDADKAFFYAHDMLSKVFGFVGIVIFTLVIERTGVKIVSTFGAWIDAFAEGFKRFTWRIRGKAYYTKASEAYEEIATADASVPTRVEKLDEVNFYPQEEISNNKWKFFTNTFTIFAGVSLGIMLLGLIPPLNQIIGTSSDAIAVNWFGAARTESEALNTFWWTSRYLRLEGNDFVINIASSGMLMFAILIAGLIVTPGRWKNKSIAMSITLFVIFPLNIFRLGFQKWATWALANGEISGTRPLMYLNLADMITTWFPFIFWVLIFAILLVIYNKLNVKVFTVMWAWLHQLVFTLGWIVGLQDKPGKIVKDTEEKVAISSE